MFKIEKTNIKQTVSWLIVGALFLAGIIFYGCSSSNSVATTTTTTAVATTTTATSTSTSSTSSTSTSTTTSTTTSSTLGTGPATFLYSPMDLSNISYIIPLGNTNPTGHTLPSNHIYLCFQDVNATYNVYFPAGGQVKSITGGSGSDYKITVQYSSSFQYYLGHVQSLETVFAPYIGNNNISGLTVTTGQKAGTTGKNSYGVVAMDLGVIDTDVTRTGFINSSNYLNESVHCGAPLSYYAQPTKSSLEALVARVGTSDKNGKIDYDQAGKLIGNWFSTSLVVAPGGVKSDGNGYGNKQIAFVYYNRNATLEVISIGGEITGEGVNAGAYWTQTGAASFENVSSASGIVSYQLTPVNGETPSGYLIVRYNVNDTISVEANSLNITDFSSTVKTYTR